MDKCPCENHVAVLLDTVEKHEKELNGNGREGIVQRFTRVELKVNDMEDSLEKLATSFSALARNDSNREAIRRVLGQALVKASLIVGICGVIVTLIITLA